MGRLLVVAMACALPFAVHNEFFGIGHGDVYGDGARVDWISEDAKRATVAVTNDSDEPLGTFAIKCKTNGSDVEFYDAAGIMPHTKAFRQYEVSTTTVEVGHCILTSKFRGKPRASSTQVPTGGLFDHEGETGPMDQDNE